jgi:LysR family glycine cleavage system transcriptional activator
VQKEDIMRRKLPPLNSIRSFEAVGRLGSISAAAAELSVTDPAVSRAVKNLEDHFGFPLFDRSARGLELTEHGKLLLPEITQALDTIARASSLVYEQSRFSISILATPMIASRWIAPAIGEFMRNNPDVSIRIHSSFRYDEIQSSSFDIAIWNGEVDRSGYDRFPFLSVNRVPVCAVDVAEEIFSGSDTALLPQAPLLHEYDYADWMDCFERFGLDPRAAAHGLVSDNFGSILQATLNGAGVALLFETFLDDPEIGKRMTAPFGRDQYVETRYWLYARRDVHNQHAIDRLTRYFRETLGNLVEG